MPCRRRLQRFFPSLLILAAVAACAPARPPAPGGRIAVVAAENFWGDIAAQLGGDKVSVSSLVSDPNADPHDYQSTTATARAVATAQYIIVTGAGYDSWVSTLISANDNPPEKVLTVSALVGKKDGDNPHFWYSPQYVEEVADRITEDLSSIDKADSAYFARQRAGFASELLPYHNLIASIRHKFAGTRIAATESVFAYMADALNLTVVSPSEFMKAVSEGNDPPADSVSQFQQQLETKQATVLVYNTQTATDVTHNLEQIAAVRGIPSVGITETIQPPGTRFQSWMTGQLSNLQHALEAGAQGR